MSEFVTTAVAFEILSVTPKQLAELAVKRKILTKRTMTGVLYNVDDFMPAVARRLKCRVCLLASSPSPGRGSCWPLSSAPS